MIRTAHLTTHRNGPVFELHYRRNGGVRAELAALLSAEARDYCPLLSWTLDQHRGQVGRPLVVRIEASALHPDDIDPIALLAENLLRHHNHPAAARPPTDGGTS